MPKKKKVRNSVLVDSNILLHVFDHFRAVGVDILTLANNHLTDYRDKGVKKTNDLVKKYGLISSGVVFGNDPFTKQVTEN